MKNTRINEFKKKGFAGTNRVMYVRKVSARLSENFIFFIFSLRSVPPNRADVKKNKYFYVWKKIVYRKN